MSTRMCDRAVFTHDTQTQPLVSCCRSDISYNYCSTFCACWAMLPRILLSCSTAITQNRKLMCSSDRQRLTHSFQKPRTQTPVYVIIYCNPGILPMALILSKLQLIFKGLQFSHQFICQWIPSEFLFTFLCMFNLHSSKLCSTIIIAYHYRKH